MIQESIHGKPERVQPIPGDQQAKPSPMTKQPDTRADTELMSQANAAIHEYTKSASGARLPLGKGISPNHEVFQ